MFNKVYTLQQLEEPDRVKNLQYVYYSLIDGVVDFKTKEGHLLFFSESCPIGLLFVYLLNLIFVKN